MLPSKCANDKLTTNILVFDTNDLVRLATYIRKMFAVVVNTANVAKETSFAKSPGNHVIPVSFFISSHSRHPVTLVILSLFILL